MSFGIITLIIVVFTVIISIAAFNDQSIVNRLILWPYKMTHSNEYHRLLTSGFIHADYMHLFFNMFTMFFIGSVVERQFVAMGGKSFYLILYFAGIIVASLPSFIKHRNHSYYRSLGASGGVAAIMFSMVYFAPWEIIYIWFLPLPIIVFAVLYLIYSAYMSRKGGDYINHDAHFWGAVFGFVFTLAVDPDHGRFFFAQLLHPRWG